MAGDTSRSETRQGGSGSMTTAFEELTRVLRTHRSHCENGDDWPGQMVPSSVVFTERVMKVALKISPTRMNVIDNDMLFPMHRCFSTSPTVQQTN